MVWSDESRFALFKSDGWVRVWRNPGDTYSTNSKIWWKISDILGLFWLEWGWTFSYNERKYKF